MRKLLSYLFPQNILKQTSKKNGVLEVNLVNGRLVLDTENSNYSYGSLQQILKKGLQLIPFTNDIQQVLVLGMGAGSVVETIRKDFKSHSKIDLVDFDPEIIAIAKEYFHLNEQKKIQLFEADAFDFVDTNKSQYDLIIVDLFIGDTIPNKFLTASFFNKVANRLASNGVILFNTMIDTLPSEAAAELALTFKEIGLVINKTEKVFGSNNLYILKKPIS